MKAIIIKEDIKCLIENYLPKMDSKNIDTFTFYLEDKLRNCNHYFNVMTFEDKILNIPKYIITPIDYNKTDNITQSLTFTSYDSVDSSLIIEKTLLEFINKHKCCNYTCEINVYIELTNDFGKYFDDDQIVMIEKYNVIN